MPTKTKSVKEAWEKLAPKKSGHTKLTPQSKAKAKTAAKKGGRKYPSLVDNMNAAKKQKASRTSKQPMYKSGGRAKSSKKSAKA